MSSGLTPIPRTQKELLRSVQAVLFAGKSEIEFAWEFSDWEKLVSR